MDKLKKVWELFKGHKSEILLVAIAVVGRLGDSFPLWPYWGLTNDLLTILAGGTITSRIVRTVKDSQKPAAQQPPNEQN